MSDLIGLMAVAFALAFVGVFALMIVAHHTVEEDDDDDAIGRRAW